ncbi:helix-turn-helix transcriptional regulator [Aquimarina sp. MMG016]|uniref:helix-turn-helix transcriptional regulator n=1 Tax=Aquimarina sp. MMG016 TaxID=2822690 RepID=UPI001B39E294|nr:helix-turn-helix transcriptional regulator [Aquimarina sp. MMG016]MBQ4819870.1 helix-turn-helix transcriptional regulator [Aquimarina sp. MMG016]
MSSNYLDQYYNLFSNNKRQHLNPLTKDKNYLMRFHTFLPYSYSKEQNSFSLVYSNSSQPMNLITPNGSSKLKKNQFTILNPKTDWEFVASQEERIDILSFILSEEIMSKFSFCTNSSETKLLDTPFDTAKYDSFFIETMYKADHSESGRFLKQLYAISNTSTYQLMNPDEIVFELLGILYKEQSQYNTRIENIRGKKQSTKREIFKRILIAFEYINDNFEGKKINIDELALTSGLSEYHLYSSFKAIYKKTPHQYLNHLRMKKAKQYLDSGKMTISEVSDRLQFPDLASFSKLFKKTYGVAPSKLIYS